MEDINLSMFNMITGINESKTFAKYISRKCKCKFDERKRNSDQWWNNDKCRCECKKHHLHQKDYIWNLSTCSCENCNYSASIMVDSALLVMKLQTWKLSQTTKKQKHFQQILMKKNIKL